MRDHIPTILSCTLFLLLSLSPVTAFGSTCAGACGGGAADGTCFCDDLCFDFDPPDCCGDVCAQCPSLSGCGGDPGGTCPDGTTYEGCCDGQTLKFCQDGTTQMIDCNQEPSCGWQPTGPYYDCATAGSPDPSGMNPMACSGGTTPVCGNGACEVGENTANCPNDCGGGNTAVCGNGICEQGETANTCPADCGGAAGCGDKECGQDAQGNSCGTCPADYYCSYEGQCVPIDCVPDCEGKLCGDNGCNGSCGVCPVGLECTPDGSCVGEGGEVDVTSQPADDAECFASCENRVCGDDGCGGSCGICPVDYGCTPDGLCEPGYVPITEDIGGNVGGYNCAPGESLKYGKCVPQGEGAGSEATCSAGGKGSTSALALLLVILLACAALGRSVREAE